MLPWPPPLIGMCLTICGRSTAAGAGSGAWNCSVPLGSQGQPDGHALTADGQPHKLRANLSKFEGPVASVKDWRWAEIYRVVRALWRLASWWPWGRPVEGIHHGERAPWYTPLQQATWRGQWTATRVPRDGPRDGVATPLDDQQNYILNNNNTLPCSRKRWLLF